MREFFVFTCVSVLAGALSGARPAADGSLPIDQSAATASRETPGAPTMDTTAEEYVRLVLALGQHDRDYVDAYYGPPAWKTEAVAAKLDLPAIGARAAELGRRLESTPAPSDEMARLRLQYLSRQLSAVQARVRILGGERLSFDAESKALYDAVAPTFPESHFQEILDRLEKRFPGTGPLVERYDAFRHSFVIPPAKLDAVFQKAIQACAERTRQHISLPAGGKVHCRIRDQQILERLQLVPGRVPQPDSGQHRSADLHRSGGRSRMPRGLPGAPRVQRAAREAPRQGSRLGRVHRLSALLTAVAHR